MIINLTVGKHIAHESGVYTDDHCASLLVFYMAGNLTMSSVAKILIVLNLYMLYATDAVWIIFFEQIYVGNS